MSERIVHFEINSKNIANSAKFYTDVFGWKIKKWGGPVDYWTVDTGKDGEGINGGIMNDETLPQTVNTIEVKDIDAVIAKILEAGGQEIRPKFEIPGMGWMAYMADSEGNIFGLMQSK